MEIKNKKKGISDLKLGYMLLLVVVASYFIFVGHILVTEIKSEYELSKCENIIKVRVQSSCYEGRCDGRDPRTGDYYNYKRVCNDERLNYKTISAESNNITITQSDEVIIGEPLYRKRDAKITKIVEITN